MSKLLLIISLVIMTASCAHQRRVIVDMQGVNRIQYQADLQDCQSYALQVKDRTAKGALAGGLISGAIGAALGNKEIAQRLAGAGAISGAVKGNVSSKREQEIVVRRCLRGRGYRVLN